jgi:uncharacterized protein (DUF2062 family)
MATIILSMAMSPVPQLLAHLANRTSLAAGLAVGLLVVIAMVIGDVLDREQRRDHHVD